MEEHGITPRNQNAENPDRLRLQSRKSILRFNSKENNPHSVPWVQSQDSIYGKVLVDSYRGLEWGDLDDFMGSNEG
jgi:hypothetical protein